MPATALADPLPAPHARVAQLDLERVMGPVAWRSLDPQVRRRFAPDHATAVYRGTLTTRHSRAGAVFAWIGAWLGRPLPLRSGRDIPAEVRVRPNGAGGVVWERWLLEPGRAAVCVRSTKQADADGEVSERTDRLLGMVLAITAEDGALVFESQGYFLALGRTILGSTGRRVRLPALLTPGRCRVTHAPAGAGQFRFTLDMTHPFWGCTVVQDGIFHDTQESTP